MTIIVDVATFGDAIAKAARVSPTNGDAAKKTPGIVITSDGERTEVLATDVATTYRQRLYPESQAPCYLRLPSKAVAEFVKQLSPTGSCEIEHKDDGRVCITSESTTLKIQSFPGELPTIPRIPRTQLARVDWFARSINHVAWATTNDDGEVLSGVHLDGKRAWATDKSAMASCDLELPVDVPITVPLATLTQALKGSVDVEVGATKRRLLMMPDTDTEITSVLLEGKFPPVGAVMEKAAETTTHAFTIDKKSLTAAISRVNVLANTTNTPAARLLIEDDDLLTMTTVIEGLGEVSTDIDIKRSGDCGPVRTGMSTRILRNICGAAHGDTIDVWHSGTGGNFVRFGDETPSWNVTAAPVRMTDWEAGMSRA